MRGKITIALIVLFASKILGQNFEGKIVYRNLYKSKMPAMKDEQFTSMMGSKQEFYIKAGNYKSITNGTFAQWQLYINKDNKIYSKMSNSEIVLWNDASVYSDSVLKVEINKNVIEILGYMCDELILNCKGGIQKFYFNSKLSIDPTVFSNHKYAFWYDYLIQTKSLPLKTIIVYPQFIMESMATEVKPSKIDDKEFQLPSNTKTSKNPY